MDLQNQHRLLDEIDQRQDDVLQQLEDLNRRIEAVLHPFQSGRGSAEREVVAPALAAGFQPIDTAPIS